MKYRRNILNNTNRSNWFCKYKIAHRGLHSDIYPENSLGAFENACKLGFAIELDVRATKDGEVVCFHDGNLRRLCKVDCDINDIESKDLSKYTLLDSEYSIPTLKEVLDTINGKTPLMIEIKPTSKKDKLEEKVYKLIKDYKGDIAIKSFNPFVVMWFKKHAPEIPRGMLSSFFNEIHLPFIYKALLKRLFFYRWAKPDFISYDINNLPNKYLKNRNVPILTWVITSSEMEKIALTYADNVIFENYIPKKPTNY